MKPLKGACIIGQSGGPTAVINASALGAIQTALQCEPVTRVLGAANGIEGVLKERLFDMAQEDPEELELLKYTPASALGSCRYRMADPAACWRCSGSTMYVTFSTMAAMIPWIPATRYPNSCSNPAMNAA